MSEWYNGYVTTNGISLHYSRTGGDKPPLVLSHGITDQGLCWALAARELRADYDVIMPDARGHGLSEAPAGGDYGIDAQADDLAGLIEALGLEKPRLGGHSMGAVSALYLAAAYPELPRCLFLEDPPFAYLQDAGPAEREEAAGQFLQSDRNRKAMAREQLIAWCRRGNPTWSDDELEFWGDAKPHVRMDFLSFFTAATRLPWREALGRVTCPVLLLVPERGYAAGTQAEEMARIVPSLQVATVAGTGHCIRRDRPEEYLRLVRQFLAGA
ncbi:MAG: alpha/beta fold hydrolase [Anaerolineae bacterium]